MKIVEFFSSKQGEGLWTGEKSTFIRFLGCNLRCRFCDTKYAWQNDGAADLSVSDILEIAQNFNNRHVVLTGGEPFIQRDLSELTEKLDELGFVITIETSGTLFLPVRCHLMSISPKLSNSGESNKNRVDVVESLIKNYDYQLKFVIDSPYDIEEMEIYLKQFSDVQKSKVYLMPQAVDAETHSEKEAWIKEYCSLTEFQFSPRMQIFWFGNKRGK